MNISATSSPASSPFTGKFPRRSVTLPVQPTNPPNEDPDRVEILFSHPSARVVTFKPVSRTPVASPNQCCTNEPSPGSLPWASRTERTLSSGPLKINRLYGAAFLNAGDIAHPLLPRSQCWCVDGETKFVLRIREDSYYRIELPNETDADKANAETLKEKFPKILRYEKTPCPFQRGFFVDLPEPPETPVKKVPWKPLDKPTPETPSSPDYELGLGRTFHARPTPSEQAERRDMQTPDPISPSPDTAAGDIDESTVCEERDKVSRPKISTEARSITAPPLAINPTYLKWDRKESAEPIQNPLAPTRSFSSSVDSFHSFQSSASLSDQSPSQSPPRSPAHSPPSSPALSPSELKTNLELPRARKHRREISELTITPQRTGGNDFRFKHSSTLGEDNVPSLPSTPPTLESDTEDHIEGSWSDFVTTPSFANAPPRRSLTHKRSLSPLPPAANLYYPSSRHSSHHLTTAIIQRTCALMLGTPLHVVRLMLQFVQRLKNGTLNDLFYGYGEKGERIPCQWDESSDSESDGDGSGNSEDEWAEDDYGVPLNGNVRRRAPHEPTHDSSWEVD